MLYAGEVLDGGLLQILPGGRPAAEPGAGGRADRWPGPRPAALCRLRAGLCAGGQKGVLFGGLRRDCAEKTPARLYAETAAGLLAFAAEKPACIKAFRARFIGGRYVSMSGPHFPAQKLTFERRLSWTKIKAMQS